MGRKKKDDSEKKPKDDPAMANARILFKKSGLSLVDLGRRMGYSEEIARQSAWQFMKSRDPRMSMLRKFAAAMSVTVEQLGTKGKRMSRKLDDELAAYGCEIDPIEFRDTLVEMKQNTSPAWTIDELVCNPDEAKEYCDAVRAQTKCEALPNALILRTLMNIRRSN